MVGPTTPLVVANAVPRLVVYFTESAKYASSAVTRFRRSDFIEARYAFSFVLANFGIAMAAKIPMITTTIRSSIRVKPLRFIRQPPRRGKSRTLRTKTPVLISASNMPPEAYIAYLATAQEDSPFDVAELDPPDYSLTPAFCETLGRTQGPRDSPKIRSIPGSLLRIQPPHRIQIGTAACRQSAFMLGSDNARKR